MRIQGYGDTFAALSATKDDICAFLIRNGLGIGLIGRIREQAN